MVDYAEIKGQLDAQWNAAIIAEPTYYDGNLKQTSKYPGVLFITVFPSTLDVLGPGGLADIVDTDFLIKIISSVRTDLEKYISEIKRIINTKDVAGGHWRILTASKPIVVRKRYTQTLSGVEKLFVSNSNWS